MPEPILGVNTYCFTQISHGTKQVIMLPPTCTWISELPKEFPLRPNRDFVAQIVSSGGFYFELRAGKRVHDYVLFTPMLTAGGSQLRSLFRRAGGIGYSVGATTLSSLGAHAFETILTRVMF